MEIEQRKTSSGTVVRPSGDVDLHNSSELRSTLHDLVETKTKRIVVDLGKVGYMDSSGLATLIECLQGLRGYSGELRLANVPEKVRAVFALAQLEKLFKIYESAEEALKQ